MVPRLRLRFLVAAALFVRERRREQRQVGVFSTQGCACQAECREVDKGRLATAGIAQQY
jgi:hypothetical protein